MWEDGEYAFLGALEIVLVDWGKNLGRHVIVDRAIGGFGHTVQSLRFRVAIGSSGRVAREIIPILRIQDG
jgi:hypothetical protein